MEQQKQKSEESVLKLGKRMERDVQDIRYNMTDVQHDIRKQEQNIQENETVCKTHREMVEHEL